MLFLHQHYQVYMATSNKKGIDKIFPNEFQTYRNFNMNLVVCIDIFIMKI